MGAPVLLTHGDLLCTDDIEYQAFRQQVHDIDVAAKSFLPSHWLCARLRSKVCASVASRKNPVRIKTIMDVNADAVAVLSGSMIFTAIDSWTYSSDGAASVGDDGPHAWRAYCAGRLVRKRSYLECTDSGCISLAVART